MAHAIILAAAVVCLLAGCIGDSGGSASVSFDGTGNGTHSDSTKCDSDGTLVSSGQVDAGQVDVVVRDGDGTQVFSERFDGGSNFDTKSLHGSSGTWTVTALRSSDAVLGSPFSGHYSFKLGC